MAKQFPGGVPDFRYFNLVPFGGLAGRGGAVRFCFLRNGIKFTETLVPWGTPVTEEQNPVGRLPVVGLDGMWMCEHHAILRFFEKQLGGYGADPVRDFKVDRTASATHEWRDLLIDSLLGDDAAKKKYQDRREHFYKLFSRFVEMDAGEGPHAVGNAASFADDLLFAVIYDDTRAYSADLLPQYPALEKFFNAYRNQPAISEWCSS